LWELGELSPLSLRLRETALVHMGRLYEATGENVHLAVLDGATPEESDALFVGRVTGAASIPTLSRMGGRQPLHTTGVGKALLSTRDAAWLERYFTVPLERETLHSVTDPEVLRAELARARARGYATTREEMTLGNVSVAAPVAPVQGLPPIAIGLVVHLERADERRLAPLVVQAARDLHADLRAQR
ncbi:MAG: IclR family transcriptional regulator, partial [Microbacterium sp.]|nr:IclR family transcriptional regulator [Microbacterium sp.]